MEFKWRYFEINWIFQKTIKQAKVMLKSKFTNGNRKWIKSETELIETKIRSFFLDCEGIQLGSQIKNGIFDPR
jgi:hypothetical protein